MFILKYKLEQLIRGGVKTKSILWDLHLEI